MRSIRHVLLLAGILAAPLAAMKADAAAITLVIEGVRNDRGEIRAALFTSGDGFPDRPEKAFRIIRVDAVAGKVEVRFEDVPYGKYAACVLHDENRNGLFDMRLFIPLEGWAASRDPRAFFGPPRFEDAAFTTDGAEAIITVRMRY
jgi:uncharacterized protein (DUF2141 family)